MALPPLAPLGKQLSQSTLSGGSAPTSAAPTAASQPVTALQWLSLVRATWMWILRPLWYLCFVLPGKLLGGHGRSDSEEQYLLDEHFRKHQRR